MKSIESSDYPLAFPATVAAAGAHDWPSDPEDGLAVRVLAGALAGMQKQALVRDPASDVVWNMVSDEGPYLNGTDLAPFPLAFFSAGLAASLLQETQALAMARGFELARRPLTVDSYYTMEGSALRGTMTGGALPPVVTLSPAGERDAEALADLACAAVGASPACALLRESLTSLFTITYNGRPLAPGRVAPLASDPQPAPFDALAAARPDDTADYPADIIEKLSAAESVFGVEGGAGSSLEATQKRQLHVRAVVRRRAEDGLMAIRVQLFKPIGSVFRFLADGGTRLGGGDRAPSPLAYLSAGIAFCFLTQLGRFAHIAKQRIERYAVVQDTRFSLPGASAGTGRQGTAEPVETHAHIDSPESGEAVAHLVDMGEQTCFLHAACRTPLKTKVRIGSDRRAAA